MTPWPRRASDSRPRRARQRALTAEAGLPPLVVVQVVSAAADAAFTVSLAGSLFFGVSVDAARPRILAYLVCTLAPFAVVGPVVGPLVDRVRGGHRMVLVGAAAGRMVACLVLAGSLQTLLFFPGAFSVLVLAKTASIAKSALLPRLVDDVNALVAANARVARMSWLGGLVGGSVGALVLRTVGPRAVVFVAALGYTVVIVLGLRVPRPRSAVLVGVRVIEVAELSGPRLALAAAAMSMIRFAVGFMTFLVAMSLKASGEPAWVFGVVLLAGGVGGFAGSIAGPLLRSEMSEDALLCGALFGLATGCVLAAGQGPRSGALLVAVVFGLAGAVGHQAFMATAQRLAPDAEMGRAFARFDARFQIVWVAGAVGAVLGRLSQALGFLVLGTAVALSAAGYLVTRRSLLSTTMASGAAPVRDPSSALLGLARALAAQDDNDLAVLVATDAVRIAAIHHRSGAPVPRDLMRLWHEVTSGGTVSPEVAASALGMADRAIGIHTTTDDPPTQPTSAPQR